MLPPFPPPRPFPPLFPHMGLHQWLLDDDCGSRARSDSAILIEPVSFRGGGGGIFVGRDPSEQAEALGGGDGAVSHGEFLEWIKAGSSGLRGASDPEPQRLRSEVLVRGSSSGTPDIRPFHHPRPESDLGAQGWGGLRSKLIVTIDDHNLS